MNNDKASNMFFYGFLNAGVYCLGKTTATKAFYITL